LMTKLRTKISLAVILCLSLIACNSERKINGEVSVVTGDGQNIKLGGIFVKLYRKSADELKDLDSGKLLNEPPLRTTTTDPDGKFTFTVMRGEYAVVASYSRLAGLDVESYSWVVPADARSGDVSLSLNNQNMETGNK
jgi:hypothetical protein